MFPLRRIGDQNVYYYESNQDSDLTLIFVPGGFNPEVWKHQLKYFSRKLHTISFRPTKSKRGFEGEKEALENILEQDNVENVVLISTALGNPLIQSMEDNDKVMATVFTGMLKGYRMPGKLYSPVSRLALSQPKIFKKMFFCEHTEYKIVKDFLQELEFPDYDVFQSFLDEYDIRTPVKSSLVIHSEHDTLSSLDSVKKLEGHSTSLIKRAGSFPFFEKPQEYNKALNDFLVKIDQKVEDKDIYESNQENRSLFDFQKKIEVEKDDSRNNTE